MCVSELAGGLSDEVIVPAYTFPAGATCVMHHHAVSIFVGVDLAMMLIGVGKIEEKLSSRTRAILPCPSRGLT